MERPAKTATLMEAQGNSGKRRIPVNLSDDLLIGVPAIAEFTGEARRKVYYNLEKGLWPGFKIGDRWYMRKSPFIEYIEELEEAARRGAKFPGS